MKSLKNGEKSRTKRFGRTILLILAGLLLLIVGFAFIAFSEELRIINSIEKAVDDKPVYYMEVNGDYHFEDFLKSGGASSDDEVGAFLTKCISKGFYSVDVQENGPACSTISATAPDGSHVWGRNFDWTGSVPIIVKCIPNDGYASVSTCDFQNITNSPDVVPEDFANKMLAIAALYVPMDGVNEAGLCVADLQVNEGGMPVVDTNKPDLTVTTAIRLVLNKAADVDEAVELLTLYDIHASGGISHHLAISDASGASVSVEFTREGIEVVNTNFVTNFNMAIGDTSAGGESAKQRYEYLVSVYEQNNGSLTVDQIRDALNNVAQTGEWATQWSVVYGQNTSNICYYFERNFENAFNFSVK